MMKNIYICEKIGISNIELFDLLSIYQKYLSNSVLFLLI